MAYAQNCKPLPKQEAAVREITRGCYSASAPKGTTGYPTPPKGTNAAPDPHGFRRAQAKGY